MPGNNFIPKAWIGTQQMIGHFQGTTLFTLDGTDIIAPEEWPDFSDIRMLCNSRCSFASNGSKLGGVWTALLSDAGVVTVLDVSIDAYDRIVVAGLIPFAMVFSTEVLGFEKDIAQTSIPIGGLHTITAGGEWVRGNIQASDLDTIYASALTAGVVLVLPGGTYESVSGLCEASLLMGSHDLESRGLDNITQLTVTAKADTQAGRFLLNDAGRILWVIKQTYADPDLNTDFMRWLGYDGTEVFIDDPASTAGNTKTATANRYAQGLAVLDRPLDTLDPHIYTRGDGSEHSDGHIERSHIYTIQGYDIAFTLKGNAGDHPTMSEALRTFFVYLFKTAFITVWPDSAEHRQAVKPTDPYSVAHTGEFDGTAGFIRLSLPLGFEDMPLPLANPSVRADYLPVQIACRPYIPAKD